MLLLSASLHVTWSRQRYVERSDKSMGNQQAPRQQPACVAYGANGQLVVYPDRIILQRKGLGAMAVGGGAKQIGISQISAVEWKGAGLTVGYIRFTFPGARELHGASQAYKDENAVTFRHRQQKQFEQARTLIDQYRGALASGQGASPMVMPSAADELARWVQLRDQGVISPAEFEAKKRQLLGL